jgi:hypothetical protein
MAYIDVHPDAILEWAKADSLAPLMIRPAGTPISPSKVERISESSSIGFLDPLPMELVYNVLDFLDFTSLCRFSRTSLRAKLAVERLPAWRELTHFASSTLIALGRTKTIKLHSAGLLRATLRSNHCVGCGRYPPYLSLLTCERICWEELWYNPSHWVITVEMAERCLGLSRKEIDKIPILSTIPLESPNHPIRGSQEQLVNFKAAKELAIRVHRTQEAIVSFVASKIPGSTEAPQSGSQWYFGEKHLSNTPLDRRSINQGHGHAIFATERFIGQAHILFPFLSQSGTASHGLRCCGCWVTLERITREELFRFCTEAQLSLWRQTWQKDKFLEHVEACEGMAELLSGPRSKVPQWMYFELQRWNKFETELPAKRPSHRNH